MGNRRIILLLLLGIGVCGLFLWASQRRIRLFPSVGKNKAELVEHVLDGVDRVMVERGDARIGLVRKNGVWEMDAPFSARVDQGAATRLLDAFETARVTDTLSFQELRRRELALRDFGLAPARVRVALSGPGIQDDFLFGAQTPIGTEVYVRMNGFEQVLVVPVSLYRLIPRTADDFRSRMLAFGNRALVRSLDIRVPGKPFLRLARENGSWRLLQPVPSAASDSKAEALVDVLYRSCITRFVWPTVSNVMDVAESDAALRTRMEVYGFGSDAGTQVQLQETGSEAPVRIVFGHPLDGEPELSYVLLPGNEAIGVVSNGVADAFRILPSAIRDTRLFADLPGGTVRRLHIYFGDLLYVLAQTNSLWRLEAPVSDVADQAVVKDTVDQLLRLNAEAVIDPSSGNGLDAEEGLPISHVELFTDKGDVRLMVMPDDIEGHFYRVAFTNASTLFRVASSNVPPALISRAALLGLRDKTVLALANDSMRRIVVRRADGSTEEVEREAGASLWRLGEAQSGQLAVAHLDAMTRLLAGIRAERIEKLGLTADEQVAYGLRAPWLEVSVDVDTADTVRRSVLVGKAAGAGRRYAMVRGLDVLFVLNPETVTVLSAHLLEPL